MAVSHIKYKLFTLLILFIIFYSVYYQNLETKYVDPKATMITTM